MDGLTIEFRPHPSRQPVMDPQTRQPILDAETGKPLTVPLFPDQRSVFVNGTMVAYCWALPDRVINFLGHFPPAFAEAVREAVNEEYGGSVRKMGMPPPPEHIEPDPETSILGADGAPISKTETE